MLYFVALTDTQDCRYQMHVIRTDVLEARTILVYPHDGCRQKSVIDRCPSSSRRFRHSDDKFQR